MLRVQQGMEAVVRIFYVKASLESNVRQAGTLEVNGQQVGTADNQGSVTLQGELADRLFAIKDDPFAAFKAQKGVRAVEATLEGHDQSVRLKLHFRYTLAAAARVHFPSPEFSSPCCATVMEVKPGSITCAIDNSDEQMKLSHSQRTTIPICATILRPVGQRLMVLHEGKLADATVVASPSDPSKPARHLLLLPTGTEINLDLNEFNHCVQRLESVAAYEAARASFCESLRDSCATVQDAITGTQLQVEDQTLQINPDYSRGVQREKWLSAPTIKDLAPLLLEPSSNRACGAHEVSPGLIEAPPGTGKVCGPGMWGLFVSQSPCERPTSGALWLTAAQYLSPILALLTDMVLVPAELLACDFGGNSLQPQCQSPRAHPHVCTATCSTPQNPHRQTATLARYHLPLPRPGVRQKASMADDAHDGLRDTCGCPCAGRH